MPVFLLMIGLIWSCLSLGQPASKFIVFGDSLSDTGNAYEFSHHSKPPDSMYYHGRYSDGPVWIDYVLEAIFPKNSQGKLLNYAFGGSGVLQSQAHAFTLSQEVDSYLSTHPGSADSRAWFIIWMGANDYLLHPDASKPQIRRIISELERNLLRLQAHGAQHIVVVGLPDLSQSPFAQDLDLQAQLSRVFQMHNHTLQHNIADLQSKFPDTLWRYMDVNQVLSALLIHPKQSGFMHTKEQCIKVEMIHPATQKNGSGLYALFKDHKRTQPKCRDYVFLDQFHPTTQVHKLIAQQFLKMLN